MFDRYLRPLKDRLLAPLARALGPALTPNTITWLAWAIGLGSAAAVLQNRAALALALWLVNRLLDGLDGTQARVHARETDFGAYLDIVLDFFVYAAIPLAMAVVDGERSLALATALLLASFYVNAASWMYLSALLEQRHEGAASRGEDTAVTMPPGIVAGTETLVLYTLFFLIPGQRYALFVLMALLVLIGVVQRMVWASVHLRAR